MTDCKMCGSCCSNMAIEIDKPTCKNDYHTIMWFLLHKDVKVYVDHENGWLVEFQTPCRWYTEDGCKRYKERPKMCIDYSSENCIKNGSGKAEKVEFRNADEFLRYLKRKKIDYKFKRMKG